MANEFDVPRHGRQKKHGMWGQLLAVLGIAVLVVGLSGAAVASYEVAQITAPIHTGVPLPDESPVAPPPGFGALPGAINLLLVGTDTRSGQGGFQDSADLAGSSGAGNNDVTILMHVAADHHTVSIVSFPRDLMVNVPACPGTKGGYWPAESNVMLNSTLSRGGLACPVLTIEQLTGLKIPYAASISFDGVAAMSNAVGGVSVCVASAINDPYVGLHLSKGHHTIKGYTALKFVRDRHGVGDGSDLGRISNQQVFLSALARKLVSGGTLGNPIELIGIAKAATTHMTLSSSLTNLGTMVGIAVALKSAPLQNMVMLQYPVATDPASPDRVIVVPYAAGIVNQALQKDQHLVLTGGTGRGAVTGHSPTKTSTSTPTPGSTSTPPPSTGPTVKLPSDVPGQTAAQTTCSKGNGG